MVFTKSVNGSIDNCYFNPLATAMSHSQPTPGTTYRSPINVKNMIHTLERDHKSSSREASPAEGLTKSRSFNDLHLVDDDDGWLSLDPKMLKKLPAIPPSPTAGKPPKPPARKKKMQGPAKSTDEGKSEKPLATRPLPRRPDSDEIKRVVVIPTKTEEPVRKVSPILPPKVPKTPYPAAQNGNLAVTTTTISGPIVTSNSFSTAQTKMAAKTISSKVMNTVDKHTNAS